MVNFEYDMLFNENDFDSALDKCIDAGRRECYKNIEQIVFRHIFFSSDLSIGFVTYDTTEHGIIIGNNCYGDKC